uniref:Uncharacterized protein n=2 Tax=Ditylum brightwellii TaxID=49249 RepID=A0A7S4SUP4_9STRA|mmetsp:Transcript_20486/g.29946  ORF Transcript_20486/g.29946 Transcript_20486/m.29946 type:complete len:454 (+) Transcript_20486:374-1735(+)
MKMSNTTSNNLYAFSPSLEKDESDASSPLSSQTSSLSLSPPSPPSHPPPTLILQSQPKGTNFPSLLADNIEASIFTVDSMSSYQIRERSTEVLHDNSKENLESRAERLLEKWCPQLFGVNHESNVSGTWDYADFGRHGDNSGTTNVKKQCIRHIPNQIINSTVANAGMHVDESSVFLQSNAILDRMQPCSEELSVVYEEREQIISPISDGNIRPRNFGGFGTALKTHRIEQVASINAMAAKNDESVMDYSTALDSFVRRKVNRRTNRPFTAEGEHGFEHVCSVSLEDKNASSVISNCSSVPLKNTTLFSLGTSGSGREINIQSNQDSNDQQSVSKPANGKIMTFVCDEELGHIICKQNSTTEHSDKVGVFEVKHGKKEIKQINNQTNMAKSDRKCGQLGMSGESNLHRIENRHSIFNQFYDNDEYVCYLAERINVLKRAIELKKRNLTSQQEK